MQNKKVFSTFVKNVEIESRITSDINIDPFYSEENYKRLSEAISDAKAGRNMAEHELIEVD